MNQGGNDTQEASRARFEREQMQKSLRVLQFVVLAEAVVMIALAWGSWDTGRRIQSTTNAVNGLRENIQGLFSDNVPLVERLNVALANANSSAEKLNTQLNGDGGVNSQMDEAMAQMKTEIPRTFETFFKAKGPDLMKGALHDPGFQEDARLQVSNIIKDSMNDPSVQEEMSNSMRKALKGGLTKKQ